MACLERHGLDEEAFGHPFYRIGMLDFDAIGREIAELRASGRPFAVDARMPADDLAAHRALQAMGFRKTCVQVRLVNDLSQAMAADPEAVLAARVSWPESVYQAHARNFTFDRFSLDPLLGRDGHDRLYAGWVRRSVTDGRCRVIHIGHDFVSFHPDGAGCCKIELISALAAGRGIGGRLLRSLVALAAEEGRGGVTTVTECENWRAFRMYARCGFRVDAFAAVFHLVEKRASGG